MRVAVVTNIPSPYQVDLFNAIARRTDVDVHVLYLRGGLTPDRHWTRTKPLTHPHTFVREWRVHPHFYLNSGLFRALVRVRPDVLVITQYASIGMQLVMYAASITRVPWIYWGERPGVEWSELPIVRDERLRTLLRRMAMAPLRWPSAFWGIGKRATEYFEALGGAPCANLPYHSDLGALLSIPRSAPSGPLRVLYSGKYIERKGVDLLARACEATLARGADVSFTFMGTGPLRDAITALAARWPERVRDVGFKQMDELPGVLAAHDVLVCPSRYDGWGMVVPEGMAAGMAVVASRATGAALDLVEPEVTGLLVEPCAWEPIAAAIEALASDPGRAGALGAAAREAARGYGADQGAARFAALLAR